MSIGRTVFALVMTLSVAMLPIARRAVPSMTTGDMPVFQTLCSCCDDHGTQCDMAQTAMYSCTATTCTGICSGFLVSSLSDLPYSEIFAKWARPSASDTLRSQTGSPPFRPPRV